LRDVLSLSGLAFHWTNSPASTAIYPNLECCHAGSDYALLHRRVFRRGVSLRQSLPKIEVMPMRETMDLVGLALSILLFAYLIITMLYPEKF
jgi:K+-transporting ATPase KdpF subunit